MSNMKLDHLGRFAGRDSVRTVRSFFVLVCTRTILSYGSSFFSSLPRLPGRTVDVVAVLPLWGDWNFNR